MDVALVTIIMDYVHIRHRWNTKRQNVHEKPVLFKYWLNNADVIPDPSHVAPMPHVYRLHVYLHGIQIATGLLY